MIVFFCLVDVNEESVARLAKHHEKLIARIMAGTWTHLPRNSVIRNSLRTSKLSEWKFQKTDIKSEEREYDRFPISHWPTRGSLGVVVTGLREKVTPTLLYFCAFDCHHAISNVDSQSR